MFRGQQLQQQDNTPETTWHVWLLKKIVVRSLTPALLEANYASHGHKAARSAMSFSSSADVLSVATKKGRAYD